MNVFYLNPNPTKCAQEHCDKHVVKMIIEYAQLMCTAHRMLDGEMYLDKTKNGRSIKRWRLQDDRETILYKASHINHPSTIWTRQSQENYKWLYELWHNLCNEYTYRYGKVHETDRKLREVLSVIPNNLNNIGITELPQAMPDHCKMPKALNAYRMYYVTEKARFAKWTKRDIPNWFNEGIKNVNINILFGSNVRG